jgi:hypothetical protein
VMKTLPLVPVLVVLVVLPAWSSQPVKTLPEIETMINRGDYGAALSELLQVRKPGGTVQIDSLIGICSCHIPDQRELGFQLIRWILDEDSSALDSTSKQKLREEADRCGYVSLGAQAGVRGSGKFYHFLPHNSGEAAPRPEEYALAGEPVKTTNPKSSQELVARVFQRTQSDNTVEKIRLVAGAGFRVVATDSFVLASASEHSEAQLKGIGVSLEQAKSFLETTFSLPPMENLLTVYTLPSIESLKRFASRVHGINVGKFCIGYSYPPDASIVAVIPRELIGTLKHELVHSLISAHYPGLPPWLDEGLASLYEESQIVKERMIGKWGWRQRLLGEMWNLRPPIPRLVQMNRMEFDQVGREIDEQAVTHATARTLLLYVQEKERLAEVFNAFHRVNPLDSFLAADKRLAAILGTSESQIDGEFVAWFRSRNR